MGIALGGLGLAATAWVRSGLMFNHSPSMPIGLYRVERGHRIAAHAGRANGGLPRRGDAVVWCLPLHLAKEARSRGYVLRGLCPGDVEPVLKLVAALPGDSLSIDANGIVVNGRPLPNSRPLGLDSRGRRLAPYPQGTYVVPAGCALLWSPHHAMSFDSRYYGALPMSGFVGIARPIWVRRESVTRH